MQERGSSGEAVGLSSLGYVGCVCEPNRFLRTQHISSGRLPVPVPRPVRAPRPWSTAQRPSHAQVSLAYSPSPRCRRYTTHSTLYSLRRFIRPAHCPTHSCLLHNICPLTRHHLRDLRGVSRAPRLQQQRSQALQNSQIESRHAPECTLVLQASTRLEASLAGLPLDVFLHDAMRTDTSNICSQQRATRRAPGHLPRNEPEKETMSRTHATPRTALQATKQIPDVLSNTMRHSS